MARRCCRLKTGKFFWAARAFDRGGIIVWGGGNKIFLGLWVNYGLGSVNQNLPGFVVMLDPTGGPISGAKNWSSGYMPAVYQGTILRSAGAPILGLETPAGVSREMQRDLLDTLGENNRQHQTARVDNSNLAARISSYEL